MTRLFNPVFLLYLLVAVLLSFHLLPGITTIGHDKQVFIYSGMAIWKGGMPYKDFFDHKPPMIFLLMALAWPFKQWGFFLLGVIIKWMAACFIDRTARYFQLPYPVVYPILFLILILSPFILMEGVLTREYAACFLAVLYTYLLTQRKDGFFTAGILAALVFYTQQEELLPALPLLFWYWLQAPVLTAKSIWQSRWEHAVQLVSGFLMFSLPIFVWFTLQNTLYGFWHQTVSFNLFIYGSDMPLYEKIKSTMGVLFHTRYLFTVFPLLLLHLVVALRSPKRGLHIAFAASFAVALLVKATLGRIIDYQAIYHYMLTFSTAVTFSVMVLVAERFPRVQLLLRPVFIAGMLTAVFLLFWKNSFSRIEALIKKRPPHAADLLLQQLRPLVTKNGSLYVMGHTPYIYLYNGLEVLSPSPWIYVSEYRQNLPFDPDAEVIDDIIRSLEQYQTQWVVDFLLLRPLTQQLHQKKWETYVLDRYVEVKRADSYILFKRKPHAKP